MVAHAEDLYLSSVKEWNRVHKIVGQRPIEELYAESRDAVALLCASSEAPSAPCMIDVGAGNGLLGVAWLFASPRHKVIFTEPDPKKASFLIKFLVLDLKETNRAKTIPSTIESVSRETFEQFAGPESYFFAARAFSGSKGLEVALREGGHLPAHVWVFTGTAPTDSEKNEKFYLKRLLFS